MSNDDIVQTILSKNLTYLGKDKLTNIRKCMDSIKTVDVAGDILEFGVALGGSAICIASEMDETRRFFGFDLFGMIPSPSDADGAAPQARYSTIKAGYAQGIGGDRYYGYVDNLYDVVVKNFESFGLNVDGQRITLTQGLFDDTLPKQPDDMVVALAHIDCDWYEPVKYCLEFVDARLSVGGFIILDDYNDWLGCKKATDEFLSSHPYFEVERLHPHAILRKRALINP